MHDVMEPTQDPHWVLNHEGYDVLTESSVEFALCPWERVSWRARLALGQPWPDVG